MAIRTANSNRIAEIWARIERVLKGRMPDTAKTLAPPASEQEIAQLEAGIGLVLPDEFQASLRIHNGQDDPYGLHGFFLDGPLATTVEIAEIWRIKSDCDDHFRRVYADWDEHRHEEWWSRLWIPFTHGNGGSDCLCINLNPDVRPGGTFGEIICHLNSNPHEPGIAANYGAWLEGVAMRLEAGEFTVKEGKWWPIFESPI
jgi:cell wall assembly regulator SMI1